MSTIDVNDVVDMALHHDFETFVPLSGLHERPDTHVPGTREQVQEMLDAAATPQEAGQILIRWLVGHLEAMGWFEAGPKPMHWLTTPDRAACGARWANADTLTTDQARVDCPSCLARVDGEAATVDQVGT